MHIERLKEMLLEVYKSYYKINPKYLYENVIVKQPEHNLRNQITLEQPIVKSSRYGLNRLKNEMKCGVDLRYIEWYTLYV